MAGKREEEEGGERGREEGVGEGEGGSKDVLDTRTITEARLASYSSIATR